MKKHAFALAALIAAACAQAQTQTPAPIYMTTAAGASHLNLDCTGATSCDASDVGAKLVGGYQFGNGLSLELAYIAFGKFRAADGALGLSVKPTAFLMGGAYALPLSSDWGLNLRLGAAQVKTKVTAVAGSVSGNDSESKVKVYVGAGLSYAVSKTLKIELGADSTEAEYAGEKGSLRLISLGATFSF
ncbi:outer membrane beta-barrel protein [Roseateles sp. P5_E7]